MNTRIITSEPLSRRKLLGGALAVAGATAGASIVGGALSPTTASAASAAPAAPAVARRPSGATPDPPAELYFHVLPSPVRAYDSRSGSAPDGTDSHTGASDTAVTTGTLRTIDISYVLGAATSATGVPETASAVMCNLTVTSTIGSGWLRVWSHGATEPPSSSINWTESGVTIANLCVSACSLGYLDVRSGGRSGSSTHFLVDVLGYYTPVYTGP